MDVTEGREVYRNDLDGAYDEIREEAYRAAAELIETASLKPGQGRRAYILRRSAASI